MIQSRRLKPSAVSMAPRERAVKDFRRLQVWHKAHLLVLAVYRETTVFPSEERFGLTSQVRRACVSIPANIAEGCGRRTDDDFARFLDALIKHLPEP